MADLAGIQAAVFDIQSFKNDKQTSNLKSISIGILFSLSAVTILWPQSPFLSGSMERGFLDALLGSEANTLLTFLEEERLLEQVDLRSLAPTTSFVEILEGVQQWQANQFFETLAPKTELGIDYYQVQHDSFHSTETPQSYLNLRLSQAIQVGKFPLAMRGDVILRDGQLDTRLTNAGLQLDHQQVLEQMKQKLYSGLQLQQFLTMDQNPLKLSPAAQQYLLNELRYRFYQQIITRGDFYKLKSRLLYQQDSLQQLIGSKMESVEHLENNSVQLGGHGHSNSKAEIVAALDSVKVKVRFIQRITQKYQQYWEGKKAFNQETINELSGKSVELAESLRSFRDPRQLKAALLARTDLNLREKWLLLTKDMEIGLFHLRGSGFTIHNLALNGLHYATEGRRWFGEVAWGRQSFSTNFFPTFSTSLLNRFSGNRNIYASVGLGQEEGQHLRLSILNVREGSGPKDTLFIYPKTNTVISLSGKANISQHWITELEIAVADHDLVGTNLTGEGSNNYQPQTGAAEMSFHYQPSEGWITIGVGYFYVGSRFISLGNPFLLTNRQGLVTKIRTQIGRRLSMDLEGKLGRSISEDALWEGQLSDIQLIGSLNWQIGKEGNIQAQFSPNTFKQTGAGTFNVSNYNTLISVQGVFQHQLGQSQWSNLLGYTNYRSNFTYYDTSSLDRSHYLFAQEALHLPGGFRISTVATLGGARLWRGTAEEIFTQGSVGYQTGRWGGSLGLQILKDRFYPDWQYGVNTAWQVSIGKHLQWGVDVMWQRGLEDDSGQQRFLGHVSLRVRY